MNKKVLVTGATRGIGQAIAKKFKNSGFYVIGSGTAAIDAPDYLDQYVVGNFTTTEGIESVAKFVSETGIDILINNAGINIINDFCDIDPLDFLSIQQVNVYAPFRLCQSAIKHMQDQGWGRIVNISSVWGKISKQGRASYSASKFGIDGMTVAMANEFARQNILCNCVSPGFIDTDMTWKNLGVAGVEKMLETVPIKRLAKVEEVAELVYMLGSQKNTYISGQNIAIDGGFTRA